jgi:hypothetical protein
MEGGDAPAYGEVIGKLEDDLRTYHVHLVHVVSDGAAAIKKGLLEAARARGIMCTVCAVHALQLCMKAIMKLENVQELCEAAKESRAWNTPCATRWWSTFDSLDNVLKDREWENLRPKLRIEEKMGRLRDYRK